MIIFIMNLIGSPEKHWHTAAWSKLGPKLIEATES